MSSITVTGLSKAYKRYPSRWARLAEWLDPRHRRRHEQRWVLHDLNFTVNAGEALGIIGINGAGKSTLLKIIAGTTQATCGQVKVQGRIAALLELGMGFHPDFTGRQNVLMAGQLLGMPAHEVTANMPEIEAFAEIGDYIDQPVRVYSSGMQMRLAFSVATAIRPDILIVDEALSVGDAYFQHKSFNRIREFRNQGSTLLLVSHDKQAIQSVCDRALLLNAGSLAMAGSPEMVMDYYNALLADHQNQHIEQRTGIHGDVETRSGTGEATVTEIQLLSSDGRPLEVVDVGQPICLRILVAVHQTLERLVLGYGIRDRLGQVMYGTNTHLKQQPLLRVKAGENYCFDIEFPANLGPGSYSIQTALVSTDTHLVNNYEWRDLAMVFKIVNINKAHFEGCNWLEPVIKVTRV